MFGWFTSHITDRELRALSLQPRDGLGRGHRQHQLHRPHREQQERRHHLAEGAGQQVRGGGSPRQNTPHWGGGRCQVPSSGQFRAEWEECGGVPAVCKSWLSLSSRLSLTFQIQDSRVEDSATFTCVVTDSQSGQTLDTASAMLVIFDKVNLVERSDTRSQLQQPFSNAASPRSPANIFLLSIFASLLSPFSSSWSYICFSCAEMYWYSPSF